MPITEQHRKKRTKNFAVAGVLIALIVIFFVATIVKMGGHVLDRPF